MNKYNYSNAREVEWLIKKCLENETLKSKLGEVDWIEISFANGNGLDAYAGQIGMLYAMGSVFVVNVVMGASTVEYSDEFFENVIGMSFREVVTILGLQDRYWRVLVK